MPLSSFSCTLCARPIGEGESSRDHVFTEALSGHAKVPACSACNNTLGSEVEGALLRSSTVLNLVRLANGLGGRVTRGELSDGTAVEHDLQTGELRFRNPVDVQRSATSVTYTISGSREQVEQLLGKNKHLGAAEAQRLLAQATDVPVTGAIQTEVALDVGLATRLAAKAALGSARLAAGPDWVTSALAAELRDLLWNTTSVSWDRIDQDALTRLDADLASKLGGEHVPLSPPSSASQVVFYPASDGSTTVFTWVLGFTLPVLRLQAEASFAQRLPVLVRDREGGALIVRVYDAVLARGAALAGAASDEPARPLAAPGEEALADPAVDAESAEATDSNR